MEHTKCDLSHNQAKLDYEALVDTASIAVGECMERISGYQGELRNRLSKKDVTGIHLQAHWLHNSASKLAIASEVLATLLGGREREEIIIVNHNVVRS